MSDKNQETIADIVREMRDVWAEVYYSEGTRRRDGAYCDNKFVAIEPSEVADRIEAAHKRESTCEESSQVGNAAEMREALEQVKRVLHCAIVADILKGEDARKAFNAVTAALSAPPRNCDNLIADRASADNLEQAWRVFRRCNPNVYFDVPGMFRFIDWLFAEAKGEMK